MHGKEVHESRRTNRCHPSEEGLRRDEPSPIGESYSLSLKHAKGLISRQNRKERMLAAGYIPRPKGWPRKEATSKSEKT